jgi:hypothetical protein
MNQSASKTEKNFFTRLMSMDDATWARHANPWSVWTRVVTGIPVTFAAAWSVKPLAGWSVVIVTIAIFWLWLNPRLFPTPTKTDNWASKVTFGERVWLNRAKCSIPEHHVKWANFLSIISGIGFLTGIIAALLHFLLPAVAGGLVSWFGKMWFCDRMVWLYEDMENATDEYASWVSGNKN